MNKILTILVGLPGSGKSTYARQNVKLHPRTKFFEADMYFTLDNGQYKFDPSKLNDAHTWCKIQVEQALVDGYDVFVSNTNLTKWERAAYIDIAKSVGDVNVRIVICTGTYKNIHNVPEEKIQKMKTKYEPPSADEFNEFNNRFLITNL